MFDSLPMEISQNILFRLSLQCLIICTSVCKSWNSMIKNSDFIRDQLKFKNQYGTPLLLLHCNTRSETCITLDNNEAEAFYSLHYDNDDFAKYCNVEVPIFVDNGRLLKPLFRVVGTCNGLVCLADDLGVHTHMFIICNPLIRKAVILPLPYSRIENYDHILSPVKYNASVGFGYDAYSNDYKVVRLVTLTNRDFVSRDPESYTVAEVYSLATGSWSLSRLVDGVSEVDARTPQALVNGVLHWPAVHDGHYFILTFDVHTESFSEIMMPEVIPASTSAELRVSVSRDRKSIALFSRNFGQSDDMSDRFLDIWVMQEYGVHESWTKWTTLPSTGASVTYLPRALCFRVNGEIVAELLDDDVCRRFWRADVWRYACMGHRLYSIHRRASRDPPIQWRNLLDYSEFKYYNLNPYKESLVLLDMDNAVSY